MTYWAEISDDGLVKNVLVGQADPDEAHDWLLKNLGGVWVQTWTDGSQRFHYAGIGYTYDETRDAFIPPQPFDSWVLNEDTCLWEAPVPYPGDGLAYSWDEAQGDWVEIQEPSA